MSSEVATVIAAFLGLAGVMIGSWLTFTAQDRRDRRQRLDDAVAELEVSAAELQWAAEQLIEACRPEPTDVSTAENERHLYAERLSSIRRAASKLRLAADDQVRQAATALLDFVFGPVASAAPPSTPIESVGSQFAPGWREVAGELRSKVEAVTEATRSQHRSIRMRLREALLPPSQRRPD